MIQDDPDRIVFYDLGLKVDRFGCTVGLNKIELQRSCRAGAYFCVFLRIDKAANRDGGGDNIVAELLGFSSRCSLSSLFLN